MGSLGESPATKRMVHLLSVRLCKPQGNDESHLGGRGVPRGNGCCSGCLWRHALEALVTPAQLDIWATAAQYHLIHAVVVMVLALSANSDGMSLGPWPVIGFTGGVVLFSFSLYAYVLTGIAMFAMVTPLGGTAADTELVVTDLSWGQVTPASDGGQLEVTSRQREPKTMRRFTMANCAAVSGRLVEAFLLAYYPRSNF